MHHLALLVAAVFSLSCVTPAYAEEAAAPKILAVPGKSVCQSATKQLGDASARVELCVLGGNMSHDTYSLSIDRKQVLKGIDDETTTGLATSYQGEKLSMVCVPQNEAPKEVSAEKIALYQKLQNISAEAARALIIRMETVEVGRLCTARLGSNALLAVQVVFE